jgi:hypothetical protein
MDEESWLHAFKKKIENSERCANIKIEGTVNEFEGPQSPSKERVQFFQHLQMIKLAYRDIYRGETELTRERTSSRYLNVNNPVSDILIGVVSIRKFDISERGQPGMNYLF